MPVTDPAGSLLVRRAGQTGVTVRTPGNSGLRFVSFEAVTLTVGQRHAASTGSREMGLVVISGTVTVRAGGSAWRGVGQRPDPFSGPPAAVYLPPGEEYEIEAESDSEIGLCAAAGDRRFAPRLIAPESVATHVRGSGHSARRINNILMEGADACSLLITEVQSPAGNWSSYPPHKHDTENPPQESQLEETYYFRLKPSQGFAFQRVYTADRELEETMAVYDGDLVLVPRGYHVVAAAAEYQVYYLNLLAGPQRLLRMSFDPAHQWIMEGWTW
jgi:5-deoxy-glucuronate isomerase